MCKSAGMSRLGAASNGLRLCLEEASDLEVTAHAAHCLVCEPLSVWELTMCTYCVCCAAQVSLISPFDTLKALCAWQHGV